MYVRSARPDPLQTGSLLSERLTCDQKSKHTGAPVCFACERDRPGPGDGRTNAQALDVDREGYLCATRTLSCLSIFCALSSFSAFDILRAAPDSGASTLARK